MAEAPKPQRRRRRQRIQVNSAAPTADATPSGIPVTTVTRPRRRRRRVRVARLVNQPLVETNITQRPRLRRRGLTRAIKREIKREGLEGPKVSVQQKITSTFGLIGPNSSGNVELELNFFLHPALAKEANDGTAFGPLQALAAQYSLWKIKYLTLRFTPMVGSSAVSGTVVRASLNLSQSPGGSNWSGLGTRLHMDMHPGQVVTFHLRGDQIGGPRDGGWWFTDTNEEGSQSAGPIIEIHTLGKTKSTFQDRDWDGPLFLVEGIGMWQFANYQVKPALGTLERREGDAQVEIDATAGQPITMELDSNNAVAMFMDSLEPEGRAVPVGPGVTQNTVGETIFQVVDVGARLAQQFSPAPFSWLIKGGWWFVKKLLGRTRTGKSQFVVYASLQDAQNNKPAIATVTLPNQGSNRVTTDMMVTQINSPNVGPNPYVAPTPRSGQQTLFPGESFRLSSPMLTELFVRVPTKTPVTLPDGTSSTIVSLPICAIPGVLRDASSNAIVDPITSGKYPQAGYIQTPWWIGAPGMSPGSSSIGGQGDAIYAPGPNKGGYIHSLYRLINPRFTDQSGLYEFADPPVTESSVNFCVLNDFGGGSTAADGTYTPGQGTGIVANNNPYAVYGRVVATSRIWSGTTPRLDMTLSLIKVTTGLRFGNDNVKTMILAYADNASNISFVAAPYPTSTVGASLNTWNILERDIPIDSYLLGVSYTNDVADIQGVDIPTTLIVGPNIDYSRVESTFSPVFPYNLSGQMLPPTSIDTKLEYVEWHPPSVDLIHQLRSLKVPFSLPSYPSQASGEPGTCVGGQDVEEDEPELEISEASSSGSDVDSVERFYLEIGNEMIQLPSRWTADPDFAKFM